MILRYYIYDVRAPSICVSSTKKTSKHNKSPLVMSRNNVPILSLLKGRSDRMTIIRPNSLRFCKLWLNSLKQEELKMLLGNPPRVLLRPAPMANNIQSLISQYQTSVSVPAPLPTKDLKIVHERDSPNPALQIARPIPPSSLFTELLKNFQTSFNVTPETPNNEAGSSPKPTQKSALKSATEIYSKICKIFSRSTNDIKVSTFETRDSDRFSHSRTSINSLINSDEVGQGAN